jgi:two-component system alkaline phosphatase synthesis response regulator PhoP
LDAAALYHMSMSKTVLLVEDNDFIRNMYQLKLSKSGLEVVEAGDGVQALEKIKAQKPDVILLDLMMPNMGGLDVLKQLKADGMLPDLPVVVLTNVMDQQSVDDAKKLGARDYIVKTDLTPTQVVEKIQPLLQ